MKRLAAIAAAAAALALALPSLALAGGPPAGKYSAKITTPPELKGTWLLSFAKSGTYTITQAGKVVVRGHDFAVGPQVKFSQETGSKACPSIGYYNFKRTGKTLTFAKLSDPKCAGRAFVLSHSFKFVG
jgi:hypothetical protein